MENNAHEQAILPLEYSVKIGSVKRNGNTMATANVTLNGQFVIRGVKVMYGRNGLFVSPPSYRTNDMRYVDCCFPSTKEAREEFNAAVMEAYTEFIQAQTEPQESEISLEMGSM